MALHISEIGLRLSVGEPPAAGPPAIGRNDGGGAADPAQTEEIVQACVAEVLRTLKMAEER